MDINPSRMGETERTYFIEEYEMNAELRTSDAGQSDIAALL
jgi:hypothetical protein